MADSLVGIQVCERHVPRPLQRPRRRLARVDQRQVDRVLGGVGEVVH